MLTVLNAADPREIIGISLTEITSRSMIRRILRVAAVLAVIRVALVSIPGAADEFEFRAPHAVRGFKN